MKDFAVTQGWSERLEDVVGWLNLSEEAIKLIETAPENFTFGISFIGTPDENGVYHDAELVGVSLITTNYKGVHRWTKP